MHVWEIDSSDEMWVRQVWAEQREAYIQSGCCQHTPNSTTPQGLRKAPGAPSYQFSPAQPVLVVKRNDSICALFKFDVFIMHYTIRWIWQFPLNLIKYLSGPGDGSSYQRGANLQCRWELWTGKAISQIKLCKNAIWQKILKYKKKNQKNVHATKMEHMYVIDKNNNLLGIRCMTLYCVHWINILVPTCLHWML